MQADTKDHGGNATVAHSAVLEKYIGVDWAANKKGSIGLNYKVAKQDRGQCERTWY